MDKMKKERILILTITCGEGHNNIAKALSAEFESQNADVMVKDLFESNAKKKANYNNIYLWACKHVPHIYEIGWKISRSIKAKKLKNSPAVKNTKPFADEILKLIDEYKPNFIVCVHSEAAALVAYLKTENKISPEIKTITVMFDYVLCPYWETNKYLDYCITPAEFCHNSLCKVGFKEEQLKCLGFPVNNKFFKKEDKFAMRQKLGLKNKFTFFSIAGGNGLGNSLKLIKEILKAKGEYQIVVVCGKNEKNKQEIDNYIQKHNIKNVYAYGFVNNVNELMCASDICFARGGGNGISECFYSGLPIIFRKGLINNEKENAKIFVKMGFGYMIKKNSDTKKICQDVLDNPEKIKIISENISKFMLPDSTKNIVKFILNLHKKSR